VGSNNHAFRYLLVALAVVAVATPAGVLGVTSSQPATLTSADTVQGPTVTVTSVTDGDTMDIRYENGSTDTVRLLGVDTPETGGTNYPSEFEGVPDTTAGEECLATWGDEASTFATTQLEGEQVTLLYDQQADRRGDFGRLLAYIEIGDTNFNYQLIQDGYARVYDSTFSLSDDFYSAETVSQDAATGLWECQNPDSGDGGDSGSGELYVEYVHEDAYGNDNENLNDEYVVFENVGDGSMDLSGYTVTDSDGNEYTVPDGFTLGAGESFRLHTGSGTDTATDLYWGKSYAVWGNSGDTVYVYDDSGDFVLDWYYN
jgi:micrococcal nuclease